MSKMKVMCLYKNRDNKGNIVDYVLKDETGKQFNATAQQIKFEFQAGRYEFMNLQIDKAGRLVDKALPKNTPQSEEGFYSIADLVKRVNPKGRKVKCFDPKTGKEIIGIGSSLWSRGNSGLHNAINVYIKELGVLAVVSIDGNAKFWSDYSEAFPRPFKQIFPPEDEVNAYYDSVADKMVEFFNQNKKYHDLRLVIGNTYKVDAKPNPNGRYTILEVGKFKEIVEYDGERKIYNSHMYKVKDNEKGTEYWTYEYRLNIDVHNNEFTNAAIKDNCPAELIVKRDVPVTDCTELDKKIRACKDKLKSEFHKRLDVGIERTTDDQYFTADTKEFEAICNKVRKALDSLHTNLTFEEMVFDAFESVVDYGKYDKTLYYGYMGDDSGWSDADVMFSFNKDVVKKHLDSQFEDWAWSTQQSEECSEEEAKARTESYRHTNIDEEEYDEE